MKTDPGIIEDTAAPLTNPAGHLFTSYGKIADIFGVVDKAVEAMYAHQNAVWRDYNIFVYSDAGIRSTRILVDDRVTVAVNTKGDLLIRAGVGTTRNRVDVINAALARFNPEYQVVMPKAKGVIPELHYRGERIQWAGVYTLGNADRVEI